MTRIKLIKSYARASNGDILHLGCVGGEDFSSPLWLHRHLRVTQDVGCPHRLVGVDINEERILTMRSLGYEVYVCDVAKNLGCLSLGHFYLIVVGEIIEHISNQAEFLRSCLSLLSDNGTLLISTPNPFGVSFVPWYWLTSREHVGSGHLLWHTPNTMRNLINTVGAKVERVIHCTYGNDLRRWWALPLSIMEVVSRLRPTILYEIKKI